MTSLGVPSFARADVSTPYDWTTTPPVDTRQNCTGTLLGLVPSPAQFSFSVRKTWRF